MTTATPPLGPKVRMYRGAATRAAQTPRQIHAQGEVVEEGGATGPVVAESPKTLQRHKLVSSGAPLPLRRNSRAIDLQQVCPIEEDVAIEVHVGCTTPPARCNMRAILVQLDYAVEQVVAIIVLAGAPRPCPGAR